VAPCRVVYAFGTWGPVSAGTVRVRRRRRDGHPSPLRTPGNLAPARTLPIPAATSTQSDRPPSRHAPSFSIRSVTDRAERSRGDESLRSISCFAMKRRAPNGDRLAVTPAPPKSLKCPPFRARTPVGIEHRPSKPPTGCCIQLQQPARGCVSQNLAWGRLQEAARKRSESKNELTPELTPLFGLKVRSAPLDTPTLKSLARSSRLSVEPRATRYSRRSAAALARSSARTALPA
jgi:hypothetical protein